MGLARALSGFLLHRNQTGRLSEGHRLDETHVRQEHRTYYLALHIWEDYIRLFLSAVSLTLERGFPPCVDINIKN